MLLFSVCDSDHYAPLCDKSCSSRHCQEVGGKSLCNKNNGQCDYGCTSGWMGVDCTEGNVSFNLPLDIDTV